MYHRNHQLPEFKPCTSSRRDDGQPECSPVTTLAAATLTDTTSSSSSSSLTTTTAAASAGPISSTSSSSRQAAQGSDNGNKWTDNWSQLAQEMFDTDRRHQLEHHVRQQLITTPGG